MKAIVLGLTTLVAACGSSAPRAEQPPVRSGEGTAPSTQSAAAGEDATTANVNISDEIRRACGLTDAEAYFAYNSDRVRERDAGVLDKLARCFKDGPLAGRTMRLVGHADPRGDEEYNLVLGGRRAATVQRVLVARGLDSTRVSATSRGEMEAEGDDEAGWARDRRVDVFLGD
jgi:peptidoglycan-associated lipoprotein